MTLLAHYKLDDNAANTTVTATVGTNGSVVVGGNTSALAVGSGNGPGGSLADAGLAFDGVDDYASCPDPKDGANSFLGGERHTICAWLKTTDTDLYVTPVGNFHSNNPYWYLLQYNRGVNTLVSSGIGWVSTAAIFQKTTGAGEYTDGTWRHVCVTRIDNTSTKLLINGVDVGGSVSPTHNFVQTPSFNQPFFIGAYNNIAAGVASGHTACEVADVRFYNTDESANVASIIDDARPTCSVTLSGTPNVGQLFTATPLTNDSTATFEYQWYRADNNAGTNETPISGATSSTYTTQAADETKVLRCRGRSTNTGGAGLQSSYAYSSYSAEITASGGVEFTAGVAAAAATAAAPTFATAAPQWAATTATASTSCTAPGFAAASPQWQAAAASGAATAHAPAVQTAAPQWTVSPATATAVAVSPAVSAGAPGWTAPHAAASGSAASPQFAGAAYPWTAPTCVATATAANVAAETGGVVWQAPAIAATGGATAPAGATAPPQWTASVATASATASAPSAAGGAPTWQAGFASALAAALAPSFATSGSIRPAGVATAAAETADPEYATGAPRWTPGAAAAAAEAANPAALTGALFAVPACFAAAAAIMPEASGAGALTWGARAVRVRGDTLTVTVRADRTQST